MTELRIVADGLMFPEGPIAMPDGSVVLVEIRRSTLTRVHPDGRTETVAETGGGPNGAAIGPDGRVYVCNNGGFEWLDEPGGLMRPVGQARDYGGGRIEAVDLETGAVEILYTECGGRPLKGPNDIVFDGEGGFWFTDLGKVRDDERNWGPYRHPLCPSRRVLHRRGRVPADYAQRHRPLARRQRGLCRRDPDRTLVGLRHRGARRSEEAAWPSPHGGRLIGQTHGYRTLDSLAVDAEGNICVATLMDPGISIFRADGSGLEHVPMPDPYTTNICFGGADLRTAFITQSREGKLLSCPWPAPGLPLHYLNERPG